MMILPAWLDRRPETCLSDLKIYRLLDGDVKAEAPEGVAFVRHVERCKICSQRLEVLRNRESAFARSQSIEALAAATYRRLHAGRTRVLIALGAAIVLGLIGGVLLRPLRTRETTADAESALQLMVYAELSAGHVEQVEANGMLGAGESVRFQVTRPRAAYLGVVGIDAGGKITLYVPAHGKPTRVAAGPPLWVEDAIPVSARLGPQVFVVAACEAPFTRVDVRRAAHTALASAHGKPEAVEKLPLDCAQQTVHFEVVP